jgi:hypothetical protein
MEQRRKIAERRRRDREVLRRFVLLHTWRWHGDHLRSEVNDDLVLTAALRVLLPRYTGPGLTLYRGDSALNRRRRTYGLSWSASVVTAANFARGPWRSFTGGSVLLRAPVPPEAIVCATALHGDEHDEAEYLVDRRYLRRVDVIKRYGEPPPDHSALCHPSSS